MIRKYLPKFYLIRIHHNGWILAILWAMGFAFGSRFGRSNVAYISELLPWLCVQTPLIFLRVFCAGIPILLIYASRILRSPGIVLIDGFLRSFVAGFTVTAVFSFFNSAGWLVCVLFLFAEVFMLVPVFGLYIYSLSNEKMRKSLILCYGFISAFIIILERFVVSPFFVTVFTSL